MFLHEDLTDNLLGKLASGALDAALLALPVPGEGLDTIELFKETFTVALPAGHSLAKRKRVRQKDLEGENVLLLEEGHCLRDQALEICGARSSVQGDEVRATSLETLRQMVAAGIGCTLLPALSVSPAHAEGTSGLIEVREFARPVPSRTIGLATRRRYPRQEVVRVLGKLIRETGLSLLR